MLINILYQVIVEILKVHTGTTDSIKDDLPYVVEGRKLKQMKVQYS